MNTTTVPFETYMQDRLDRFGGRSFKVPEQLLRGFAACRVCDDWQKGENLFTEIVDGKTILGNLCGRCAGVWSYNPDDKTGGCLVPVIERLKFDPVWSKTADAQRFPWIVFCEQPKCYYNVATETEDSGLSRLIAHECPHRGGPTREGLMIPFRIAIEAWEELDSVMDQLKSISPESDPEQHQRFRMECRGMAKMLAIIMPPPFHNSPDEVAREALRRWEARERGDVTYQTEHLERKVINSEPPVTSSLTAEEQLAIKNALQGGFTAEQIAPIYKTTVEVVRSLGR